MSARTARKRARTESEDPLKQEPEADASATAGERERNGTPALDRDPEFWFSDGTIILVAKNVEFRYYRALLTDRSLVFKAMFAEQHPSRLVLIDEHHSIPCPVVQLADSPEDLRHILRAYVSGKRASFLGTAQPSFHQISAYIRLGRKYELNELVEQSTQLLKRHYTDDLNAWANHEHWEPSHWSGNESIGVVNLARLINEPSLLPTALLSCIYMDEDLVHGFEREDGTREVLALEDLGRCFRASRVIRQAVLAGVLRTLRDKVSPACTQEKNCRIALRDVLRGLEARMERVMADCPFRLELDDFPQRHDKVRVCAECAAMVEERIRKERVELWARLPKLLDIKMPGWGNMQNGAPQNKAA